MRIDMGDVERFNDSVMQNARVEAMCGLMDGGNSIAPVRPMLTRQQFVEWYIGKQSMTMERYQTLYVALPCNCDERSCKGWATVSNKPDQIARHVKDCIERDPDWYIKLVEWDGELW